ncbi:hypothetical protein [Vibrio ishigakensis]|uniref:hypothetical protein n=1 Tax=Vibrio ishigakensis TaxID=1481914 RepID=UPI0021C356B6|nr:hypothetical protein [Vibrio ishigakensis]
MKKVVLTSLTILLAACGSEDSNSPQIPPEQPPIEEPSPPVEPNPPIEPLPPIEPEPCDECGEPIEPPETELPVPIPPAPPIEPLPPEVPEECIDSEYCEEKPPTEPELPLEPGLPITMLCGQEIEIHSEGTLRGFYLTEEAGYYNPCKQTTNDTEHFTFFDYDENLDLVRMYDISQVNENGGYWYFMMFDDNTEPTGYVRYQYDTSLNCPLIGALYYEFDGYFYGDRDKPTFATYVGQIRNCEVQSWSMSSTGGSGAVAFWKNHDEAKQIIVNDLEAITEE